MRILAVDHGEKRVGIAVSDPTQTLARPLAIVEHVSRAADAGRVMELALANEATLIVIGESRDEQGLLNAAGRRAQRFAEELKSRLTIPIVMWDESLSSQDARAARLAVGAGRKKRGQRVDALAAAVILQSYLDSHRGAEAPEGHS